MARSSDQVICKHCGKAYRGISPSHLRSKHDYEGEHPVLEYKQRFQLAVALSPVSRKKISAAKEDFWNRRGQHWTRELVRKEIRGIHAAGKSLAPGRVKVRLREAGRRLFGTWESAVQHAGFCYEDTSGVRHWSPDNIPQRIRDLAQLGVPLDSSNIQEDYPFLHGAAIRAFPFSWSKALEAAGFSPEEHRKNIGIWTREAAAGWVQRQFTAGCSVLAVDVPRDLREFVYKRLKQGWTEFVESLGIAYPGITKRYDWSPKIVLE